VLRVTETDFAIKPAKGQRAAARDGATRRAAVASLAAARRGLRALAADPAYDLHGLLNLVDRGCPPRLATRILAPL
jgi:hypothetical protein